MSIFILAKYAITAKGIQTLEAVLDVSFARSALRTGFFLTFTRIFIYTSFLDSYPPSVI